MKSIFHISFKEYLLSLGLQAAAHPIGDEGFYVGAIRLTISIYTAPGLFMVLVSIVNIVLIVLYFRDDVSGTRGKKKIISNSK